MESKAERRVIINPSTGEPMEVEFWSSGDPEPGEVIDKVQFMLRAIGVDGADPIWPEEID